MTVPIQTIRWYRLQCYAWYRFSAIVSSYMNGYRYGGFFYLWIAKNKDADFLKKFNKSTLEIIPWSFNEAIQYALGPEYNIDTLWNEYQKAMGDI